MAIGNISNTLFPADWDTTDVSSLGTQVILGAITLVALSAIVCNCFKHPLDIESTDSKLTIIITGKREGVPQKLIDQADAAIGIWGKSWRDKLLSEDDVESTTFSAEKNYTENRHTFTLIAQKVDSLDTMQQAVELRFLNNVTFTEIPKKQKTAHSPAGAGAGRRRSLPFGGKKAASTAT